MQGMISFLSLSLVSSSRVYPLLFEKLFTDVSDKYSLPYFFIKIGKWSHFLRVKGTRASLSTVSTYRARLVYVAGIFEKKATSARYATTCCLVSENDMTSIACRIAPEAFLRTKRVFVNSKSK